MRYSIIIPVYNRPDEVEELLESLTQQVFSSYNAKNLLEPSYEIIVVEDGSSITCEEVCRRYVDRLTLRYLVKDNGGPGPARNYGAAHAEGDYLLILDSDVVLPEGWLEAIDSELRDNPCDAFGGPDAAHPSFTSVQKAISYSMTAFFTTGGIRGGKKKLDRFFPRSFNMGIRRDVYHKLGGFRKMRFGEDVDFSYRIVEAGCSCRLYSKAWVWHKRRTDFRKFYRQVYNSGIARINLEKLHPGTLKPVHMLPAAFLIGCVGLVLLALTLFVVSYKEASPMGALCTLLPLLPILLYSLLVMTDSAVQNKSLQVGLLSIPAAFIQLGGYGAGFIVSWWKRCVLKHSEFTAFDDTFYK